MDAACATRFWLPLAGAAIGALLLTVVQVNFAQAVEVPDGMVIHGCYHKSDGTLRVVDNPTKCKNSELYLPWSQTGPQGPAGTSGLSGLERVQADSAFDFVATKEVFAECPEGKKVIGGGYLHFFGGPTVVPRTNAPTLDLDAWLVDGTNFSGEEWSISAVALCATVPE